MPLAPPVAGQATGLVHRQRHRDEQHEQGGAGVGQQLDPHRELGAAGQARPGGVGDLAGELYVDQQQDRSRRTGGPGARPGRSALSGWRGCTCLASRPHPIPAHELTADALADALRSCLAEPAYRDRAIELARRIRAEDGSGGRARADCSARGLSKEGDVFSSRPVCSDRGVSSLTGQHTRLPPSRGHALPADPAHRQVQPGHPPTSPFPYTERSRR